MSPLKLLLCIAAILTTACAPAPVFAPFPTHHQMQLRPEPAVNSLGQPIIKLKPQRSPHNWLNSEVTP